MVGLLIALQPSSASGAPSLAVDPPEQDVQPGGRVLVAADAAEVTSCTLSLGDIRSTTAVRPPGTITWSWRVPRTTRRGRRTGTVSCRRGRLSATPAAIERTVAVTVGGPRAGGPGIVDAEGVTVSVEGEPKATGQRPKLTEWLQLGVALIGLTFVVVQLRLNARQARRERTKDVADARSGKQWFELQSRVGPWYLQIGSMCECHDRIRVWEEAPTTASELDIDPGKRREQYPTLSDVYAMTGMYEETGVLFNTRNIDRKHMIRYYGEEIVLDFKEAWWWIHWRRQNRLMARDPSRPAANETALYAEWEQMALTILRKRSDLRTDGTGCLWVLCIPEVASGTEREKRDEIWARHRDLSRSLTRPMTLLGELEAAVDRAPLAEATKPAGRVLCIPPWGTERGELERIQALAEKLSVRFETSGGFEELERVAKEAGGG